jgi:hypothetical protein
VQSERSYLWARNAFENDGRKLINSTSGGKLEILPRIELNRFLDQGLVISYPTNKHSDMSLSIKNRRRK